MIDCPGCGMPYSSPLSAAECEELDLAEDAGTRRMARAASRRLQSTRPAFPEEWARGD